MANQQLPSGFTSNPFGGTTGGLGSGYTGYPQTPTTTSTNPYLQFIQSPGGSSLISGALTGLGNMASAHAAERMNNQNLALQQQQMGGNQQQAIMNDQLARANALTNAAPTGWAQNYEQQTLLKNLMLQQLMNGGYQLTPTNQAVADKLKAVSPTGQLTIPAEWQAVNPFGVQQTMGSLQQRQGVLDNLSGGQGPGLNFSMMGLDPAQAQQLQQQSDQYRQYAGQQYNASIGGNRNVLNAVNMARPGQVVNGVAANSNGGTGGGGGSTAKSLGTLAAGVGMNMLASHVPGVAGQALRTGAQMMGAGGIGANTAANATKAGVTGAGMAGQGAGIVSKLGGASGLAGMGIGIGGNILAHYMPQGAPASAVRGASTGASIGTMVMPGIGTAVGAGVGALAGAIKGHQNATGGDRQKFAQQMGFGNLNDLYNTLGSMGPQGQMLQNQGLNVIGKQDKTGNVAWMQNVQNLLNQQNNGMMQNPYIGSY